MRSFQQKRGWKNIVYSKPVLLILGVFLLFFAWAVFGLMSKMQMTRENKLIAENKVSQLRKEKEKLSGDIATLKTETGVEETIRDKFGWAKAGEGLIVIVDDKTETKEDTPSKGFFGKIRSWFK